MPLLGKKTKGYKYEKLSQEEDENFKFQLLSKNMENSNQKTPEKHKRWWSDRTKTEEKIDNKKNEIMEKNMEMKQKVNFKMEMVKNKSKVKDLELGDEKL